jgi:hypothetical protein
MDEQTAGRIADALERIALAEEITTLRYLTDPERPWIEDRAVRAVRDALVQRFVERARRLPR